MSALQTLGQRQQTLLQSLLHNRKGLTVDALARELDISRNAVNQHLSSLDVGGFIENTSLSSTGGRPSKIYTLSSKGLELFPRHYALFSQLLIQWIKLKLSDEQLSDCMTEMGEQVAQEFESRVQKYATLNEQTTEVAKIMQELGYEAQSQLGSDSNEIIANNCVFHQLASKCNEVCQLDLSLMSQLLNVKVEQTECMVRDGQCCRFRIPVS